MRNFSLALLDASIRDENRLIWLDNWQKAIDAGLTTIRKPDPTLSDLVWLAGLFNLLRSAFPNLVEHREHVINRLSDNNLTDRWALRRQKGRIESSENPRRFLARDQFSGLIDRAIFAKRYSEKVDKLISDCAMLWEQVEPLVRKAINDYQATPSNRKKAGENDQISILIAWVCYGKLRSELCDDAIFGWRECRGITFYNLCRNVNRQVRNYRGARRPKGEVRASWKHACDLLSSFRGQFNSHDPDYKRSYQKQRTNDIARSWLERKNVISREYYFSHVNLAQAYRVFQQQGIRQTTIAKWLVKSGINWDRIYPRITAIARPEIVERNGIKFYAMRSAWEDSWRSKRLLNTRWIVWRDGMSDVIHVSEEDTDTADRAVESAESAINRRLESDRKDKERARLAMLSHRQQLARLVQRCRSIPQLRREDSYRVGNCHPGTAAFIQQLGLGDCEAVEGREIAKQWRKNSYCQQSYFERVILSFPVNQLTVSNGQTN